MVLILGVPFSFLEMFEETLLGVVQDVSATATVLREQEFQSMDDLLQIPRVDILACPRHCMQAESQDRARHHRIS